MTTRHSEEKTMQHRPFGSTKREVAMIGQGTWNIELANSEPAIRALRRGLDLGMTHIDTAEMYGSGAAESLVGEAIAGRRDEVFLVSKVLPHNASRNGTVAACERSLKRLKTDRLDCYLLHWRGSHPLGDTVAAFERLSADGKVLSWGVSNFDVEDLAELSQVSKAKPACNQVLYHLRERAIEHAVIPWCEENGIAVVAYSPFGHVGGFPEPHSAGGRVLKAIADRHNSTPRQVALGFLTRRASTFAIPKASNPEHAEENARASALDLSAAELAKIDAAFPLGARPRSLPML
jgi:diketogulonate reductase-like aldo/keto reductase